LTCTQHFIQFFFLGIVTTCLHSKLNMPSSNGLLAITIKSETKHRFHAVAMLFFNILKRITLTRAVFVLKIYYHTSFMYSYGSGASTVQLRASATLLLMTELTPRRRVLLENVSHSASEEIPRLLSSPKVHYRVHKGPSLSPILSIQSTTSQYISLRSILILSSHLRLRIPSFRPKFCKHLSFLP